MVLDLKKIAVNVVSSSGGVRTAGRIEFVRDQGPIRRDIRVQDFEWNPDTLRNLTKILWAVERSHGYAISALRLFSKVPSSEFSPDGMLGGKGYIQQVRDMRSSLSQAVETLSAFTDTIHDEINAPQWEADEDPIANEIVEVSQESKADPEGFVEEQFRREVPEASQKMSNPSPDDYNPSLDNKSVENNHIDDNGDGDIEKGFEGSNWWDQYDSSSKTSSEHRVADSSIAPETLPGPRVMHVGPGESQEEFGYFTDQGERPSDDPLGEGFSSFDSIIESPVGDGISPYTNPTDGDETIFKESAKRMVRSAATYSWLPGADNQKMMNYYEPGLTDSEVEWMRTHSNPDPPPGSRRSRVKAKIDPLWKSRIER